MNLFCYCVISTLSRVTHFLNIAIHCGGKTEHSLIQQPEAFGLFRYLPLPCGLQLFRPLSIHADHPMAGITQLECATAPPPISGSRTMLCSPSPFVTHVCRPTKVLCCLFCLTFLCFAPVSLFGLELQPAMLHCASSGQSVTKHAAVWGLLASAPGAEHRPLLAE